MSLPRIALSGVVRSWDGAERTGVNAAYVRALLAAGGVPLILSPLVGAALSGRALDGVDGLVLTGGEDIEPSWYGAHPSPLLSPPSRERDLFELALFATARQRDLPILGICRGIQLINVALGGTLFQDLPSERPGAVNHRPEGARDARSHRVRLQRGSRAAEALGAASITVNSSHHQAIKDLAPGLSATGWTDDDLVEAVESPAGAPWLLAVQWHPEEMHADARAPDRGLFAALVREAGMTRDGLVGERRKEDSVAHAVEGTS
ncbi:MAG TPA: gamma-glutamyl-gamma-aminobutyrate hydrolase family protein [Gemmatimonadales bacterium]